jgi:hypothetical protein
VKEICTECVWLAYGTRHVEIQPTSPPATFTILNLTTMSGTIPNVPKTYKNASTMTESSPIKKGQKPVAGHSRKEIANRVVSRVVEDVELEEFWKILKVEETRKKFENEYPRPSRSESGGYTGYLTRLSRVVHAKEGKLISVPSSL